MLRSFGCGDGVERDDVTIAVFYEQRVVIWKREVHRPKGGVLLSAVGAEVGHHDLRVRDIKLLNIPFRFVIAAGVEDGSSTAHHFRHRPPRGMDAGAYSG